MSTRPVYRRNPRRGPRCERGLKIMSEDVLGTRTYEAYTTIQDDGTRVDTRDRRSWDRRYDLDGGSRENG